MKNIKNIYDKPLNKEMTILTFRLNPELLIELNESCNQSNITVETFLNILLDKIFFIGDMPFEYKDYITEDSIREIANYSDNKVDISIPYKNERYAVITKTLDKLNYNDLDINYVLKTVAEGWLLPTELKELDLYDHV